MAHGRLVLLAHLSLWLRLCSGYAILITYSPSSIVCPLNDYFSVSSGPNFFKLHVEPSMEGGLKIYANGHSPLT